MAPGDGPGRSRTGTTADISVVPGQHEGQASFPYLGRRVVKVWRAVTVGDGGVHLRDETTLFFRGAGRLDPV